MLLSVSTDPFTANSELIFCKGLKRKPLCLNSCYSSFQVLAGTHSANLHTALPIQTLVASFEISACTPANPRAAPPKDSCASPLSPTPCGNDPEECRVSGHRLRKVK